MKSSREAKEKEEYRDNFFLQWNVAVIKLKKKKKTNTTPNPQFSEE